ncbi:hypothetical protein C0J52_18600 [Blattella germanica]|nr:hypothetical protein C0J52_18600 [Blattella germanica]
MMIKYYLQFNNTVNAIFKDGCLLIELWSEIKKKRKENYEISCTVTSFENMYASKVIWKSDHNIYFNVIQLIQRCVS